MRNKNRVALFLFIFSFFCLCQKLFAQVTARAAVDEAIKKDTVSDSIEYLREIAISMQSDAEKRSLLYFLGTLQEQVALYDDARNSYVAAAAIGGGDAQGMAKRSSEQLVLDAVRCALSCGDWQNADAYLNSAVRNSSNGTIQAYVKLYSVWSLLCRAENRDALEEPLALLLAYSSISNMEIVRPQVLFTLWYLTGDENWANTLKNRYKYSLETGIVNGSVRLLPAPFWYFVPHNEIVDGENDSTGEMVSMTGDNSDDRKKSDDYVPSDKNGESVSSGAVRMQLGLFRDRANADALVRRLGERGFSAYVITETRSSGNLYYIVLVNDPDGSVAAKLRSSGFECYRYD